MIKIYTLDQCPYCEMAKELLNSRGIKFDEVHVTRAETDKIAQIKSETGMRTFPQILKGSELIGGYDSLAELDSKDSLASLSS